MKIVWYWGHKLYATKKKQDKTGKVSLEWKKVSGRARHIFVALLTVKGRREGDRICPALPETFWSLQGDLYSPTITVASASGCGNLWFGFHISEHSVLCIRHSIHWSIHVSKVLSLLEACFDLISPPSSSMNIQMFELPELGFEPQTFSNFTALNLNFHGRWALLMIIVPYRHSIGKCFVFFPYALEYKIYSLKLYHLLNFTLHSKANAYIYRHLF